MEVDFKKGAKVGIVSGIVNGVIFSIIYTILGIKELPIGLPSFGYLIISIIFYVINGVIFGLIYGFLYKYLPTKNNVKKGITLSILGWIVVRLIPFRSMMIENPLIIVESLLPFLFLGILFGVFWNYLSRSEFY